jgi:hypothetical protein
MAKKGRWFRSKKVISSFAAGSLVIGFLFLDKGITGNVVLNGESYFDVISLIGLALVFCSAILAGYAMRN